MKVLIAGDIHGNAYESIKLVSHAVSHNASVIIQCGDMGIWPGFDGIEYLDRLNYALREHNRNLLFVPGNHEDYDQLDWYEKNAPRSKAGQVYIRSHILMVPRGCYWKWNGRYFMGVGGAVSVDRQWRTRGKSWWPQEQLTDTEADGIVANMTDRRKNGRPNIDYLFTHDCSDKTPFRDRLKPDVDSKIHRQRMDRVIKAVAPKFHFHGHMHTKYDWMNPVGDDQWVQTYGLECDGMLNNWGILNTDTDHFGFRPLFTPSTETAQVDDNF